MLPSFEEMVLRCESENSRSHIREAIRCYESGSYRAAIVATNVAVCFDLIEKLRFLASAGDHEAIAQTARLDQLQAQQERRDPAALRGLLDFERQLLELFRDKFDFFGTHEFIELDRLREDRNRCAHPTFDKSSLPFNVSAELARLHIRSAVEHVLSQPPKQGKAALESLRSIVLSPLFPNDPDQVTARLRATEVAAGRTSLINALIDELAFGVGDPTSPYYDLVVVHWVLRSLLEVRRADAFPRILTNVNKMLASADAVVNNHGCMATLFMPEIGEQIHEPLRPVVSRWLTEEDLPALGPALALALNLPWLKEEAIDNLQRLGHEQIGNMDSDRIPPEMVTRAAHIYASATNWHLANKIADSCATSLAHRYIESDIDFILSEASAGRADLIGSNSFPVFLEKVHQAGNVDVNGLLIIHGLDRLRIQDKG